MDDFGFGLGLEVSEVQEMVARSDDPRIGIHTLSEFLYCPRAGLISFEQEYEDQGEDRPPIYLDYLPQYDLTQMAAAWDERFRKLLIGGATMVLIPFTLLLGSWWLVPVLVWECLLGIWAFNLGRNLWRLALQIRLAEKAHAWKPDSTSNHEQPVDWWQLLKAGFVSHQYLEPLQESVWQLSGKPWRVLAYENMRIPVFRYHQYSGQLYPQHRARMAAYCQLIERTTGARSPYGIILLGNTFQGTTIPNSSENQQRFQQGVFAFRKMVRELKRERQIPAAPPPGLCFHCPLGKPRVYRKGYTETYQAKKPLPPTLVRGRDRRRYHSACGDRFCWLPPHEKARDKKRTSRWFGLFGK